MRTVRIEKIRAWLVASKGSWLAIANSSGVAYHTLTRFANGEVERPWPTFLWALDALYREVAEANAANRTKRLVRRLGVNA